LQPQTGSGGWTFGAKLKAWAQFNFLRLTLGNDIETNYADWQGSDEGLMIYTGAGFKNPDNITNSEGLLIEALLKPFTFAVAAGNFDSTWKFLEQKVARDDTWIYKDRYDTAFSYGARIGYEFGDLGKANVSYMINYNSIANSFDVPGGDDSELRALKADAEVFEHTFGLYGSLNFLDNGLGLTIGYLGDATMYLSEFYDSGASKMVETGVPLVYKHGIALNVRWKSPFGMTLRTENIATFWQDKDYEIFGKTPWNFNTTAKTLSDSYALIDHIVLRNGLWADYFFIEDKLNGSVFLQNTFKQWHGSDKNKRDYLLSENTARVEFGLNYRINPNARVFIKLDISYLVKSQSADINELIENYFKPSYQFQPVKPVATDDTVLTVRIPIGVTLKIQ